MVAGASGSVSGFSITSKQHAARAWTRRIAARLRYSVVALAILAGALQPAMAQVRVWEGTLTLPTYEEGQPDPNPPFDIFATNRFNYPYTLRENLTNRPEKHAWRAVYLENEY